MEKKLINNKLGQHLSEFALLFLAISLAFLGTRLYLKRGVNAKLKHLEIQLNEAMGGADACDSCRPAASIIYRSCMMSGCIPADCVVNCCISGIVRVSGCEDCGRVCSGG